MKAKELLSLWLYRVLWWFVLPLIMLRNVKRSRQAPEYRKNWWHRLGWAPCNQSSPLWIHAVSVGETSVAIPLVKQIKELNPDLAIVVTTMTPTGAARVNAELNDLVEHIYAPYDHDLAVEIFMNRVSPRALIMIETEIWPNWVLACQRKGVPVALVIVSVAVA